jgi:predicted enzyme related to lactoylglutathione lyase
MVKEIAFFAYSVRDVPKAKDFYQNVLGLKVGQEVGEHWIEFDVAGVAFGIGNGESLGYEPGKSTGVSFEVDDLASMRERLVEAGVEASEVKSFPACSAVFAKDLEGNGFALHQRKAP